MFSVKTFDFLIENKMMNSKEWFHAHRADYEEYVLKPLTQLSIQMGETISQIDSRIVTEPKINKTISRIYRDTRFSKDKSLFRESMWLSFKRDKKEYAQYPEFYVVITPDSFFYGCGYYYMQPATMKAARELILNNDKVFKKALNSFKKQNIFALDGDMFKRSKYPNEKEEIRMWLDRKVLCLSRYETDANLIFSDDLGYVLAEQMKEIAPFYDFLIKAEQIARGTLNA